MSEVPLSCMSRHKGSRVGRGACAERVFFIDNLLVRLHFIIEMVGWTGLAYGSLDSIFQADLHLPS